MNPRIYNSTIRTANFSIRENKEYSFAFGVIKSKTGACILEIDGNNRTFIIKEEECIYRNKIELQVLGSVKQREKSHNFPKGKLGDHIFVSEDMKFIVKACFDGKRLNRTSLPKGENGRLYP